jgi:tetratricopeptide (TPR) repeat protein
MAIHLVWWSGIRKSHAQFQIPEQMRKIKIVLASGDTAAACSLIHTQLKADSLEPAYNRLLARIYSERKQYERSRRYHHLALKRDLRNPDTYNDLGKLCIKKDATDSARFYFAKALKFKPNHKHAKYNIEMNQEISNLKDCLEKSVKDGDGKAHKWHFEIASIYHDLEEYRMAENYYKKALRQSPANSQILTDMGTLYVKTGRNSEAVRYFREAIKNNKNDTLALINLGRVYEKENRLDSSHYYLSKAYKLSVSGSNLDFFSEYADFLDRSARPPGENIRTLKRIIVELESRENAYEFRHLEKEIKQRLVIYRHLELSHRQVNKIMRKAEKLSKKGRAVKLQEYLMEKTCIGNNNDSLAGRAAALQLGRVLSKLGANNKSRIIQPRHRNTIGNSKFAAFISKNSRSEDLLFFSPAHAVLIFRPVQEKWYIAGFMGN